MGLLGQPVSASAYDDRFGDPPAWDVMDLADRGGPHAFQGLAAVDVPILALFGTRAETVSRDAIDPAFERLRHAAAAAPSFATGVVEGADHFYSGRGEDLAAVTLGWLRDTGLAA